FTPVVGADDEADGFFGGHERSGGYNGARHDGALRQKSIGEFNASGDNTMRRIWQMCVRRSLLTDEEHVQRIRRSVAMWDRQRRPLQFFWIAMTVAFV